MSGRIMLDRADQEPPVPEPVPPPVPVPEPVQPEPPPPPPEPGPAPEAPIAAREAEQQPAPEQPPPDWKQRVDRLTFEKHDARRQLTELQRQIQTWQAQMRQAQQPPGQTDPEERALQRFRAEAAEREFNAQCNAVFQKGEADYADFPDAVQRLNMVGYGNRPDVLAAIAALPEGHHVYRALAQNPDAAARMLNLPPMHMAMELARMAQDQRPASPPRPDEGVARTLERGQLATRAPAPLRPVGGNSARPEQPLDKVSMAEFIRRRDREEAGGSRRITR